MIATLDRFRTSGDRYKAGEPNPSIGVADNGLLALDKPSASVRIWKLSWGRCSP